MNSQSNGNCSGTAGTGTICPNPCPPRFAACTSAAQDLHPLPCPALLQCGEGFDPHISAAFPPAATPNATLPLAEVEIDTTCLCFPNIKIEFSTLIDYDATGAATPIVIQLSRICGTGKQKFLSKYTLNLQNGGNTATLPFSFVFCAENVPSDDCTYFVDIISADPGAAAVSNIIFSNTVISALAVGCQRLC